MKHRGVFEKVPGSGIWWIRYFDQFGKKHREKPGTKSVAIKLYGKRKQQVLEGKKLPEMFRKPSINFAQLVDDGLAYSKRNKRSHKADVPRFAKLKDWFGNYPAEELTPKEIESRLGKAAEKEKWAPSTFNHYRSLVSLSYRLGILNRKVTANPAPSVTHRREDNNRVRFLTDEEEKNLRKIVQEKWPNHLPELDLAMNTGIRKGSQYGLMWDMVDWKSRELHIPRTKNEEPLHVPLNDAPISALTVVFKKGDGKGRVFTSSKTGDPLENGRHWFDDAVIEAKLKNFHWHELRQTFASRLRMKGTALEDIADLLGHKSLTMTRRYAHLGPNKLHAVVSLLGSSDPASVTGETGQSATTSQVAVQ
ncbi:MAG TPA: site-specific integrase [Candidatus Dormibacteraeota bacterium]|nr:site-specific integrase [Candidatus Dormibacteraeota bacterium]